MGTLARYGFYAAFTLLLLLWGAASEEDTAPRDQGDVRPNNTIHSKRPGGVESYHTTLKNGLGANEETGRPGQESDQEGEQSMVGSDTTTNVNCSEDGGTSGAAEGACSNQRVERSPVETDNSQAPVKSGGRGGGGGGGRRKGRRRGGGRPRGGRRHGGGGGRGGDWHGRDYEWYGGRGGWHGEDYHHYDYYH